MANTQKSTPEQTLKYVQDNFKIGDLLAIKYNSKPKRQEKEETAICFFGGVDSERINVCSYHPLIGENPSAGGEIYVGIVREIWANKGINLRHISGIEKVELPKPRDISTLVK